MANEVVKSAVVEGVSAGALATTAASLFVTPQQAAGVGAIVTLCGMAWKAARKWRQKKVAHRQRRRQTDAG